MRVANIYNHLNGYEYLIVHKSHLLDEIRAAIASIDANDYIKESKQATQRGKLLYSQKDINKAFEDILFPQGWQSVTTRYFVTSDEDVEREIVLIRDRHEQKRIIEERGFEAYQTYNQVDFVKSRVALEVQFGKYFSVAYDLHVKHTFFYLQNDIDVGIEIIPTKQMCLRMDSGVAWYENEVANVIREGRNNPSVPLVIMGIEPEHFDI